MAVPDSPNDDSREERICAGCGNSVESADLRQLVVSFGNALWHPECFRCAKCNKLVDGGSSLLLLSDGNPLCSDCTFTCGVCHKSIIDEAITTGSDAYHADCFKCRACREPIQEVVFAKTRDAVFCMACHNVRIARSRKKQEIRARQRDASGDSHHRPHRDRSREGHSSRREKETVPPVPPPTFARSNSSPAPDTDNGPSESPIASQIDITSGAKRLSIIHSTAHGIPPPPPSPKKRGTSSPNRLHPNSPRAFPSELYSGNHRTSSASSPRSSYFPPHSGGSNPDSLSPTWQQTQHKDRHSAGSSPRSPSFNQQHLHHPNQGRKEGRRSFNPLDAIIDGMERPYTPRTKNLGNAGSRLASQDGGYEDTSGDGIPDALKEYFKEVVEIEDPRQRSSPISNDHLDQPKSFFETPSPSLFASSNAPSTHPTPDHPSYRSAPKSVPSGVIPAPSESQDTHTKNALSISSSRRQFEAYDGLAEEDPPPPVPPQPQQGLQQELANNQRSLISPQVWMGAPSRSRPGTANREGGNSIFTQLKVYPPPPSTASSTGGAHGYHEAPLRTPTDPYAQKPKTPTTPLSADGVIRPPPASIPRNVTSEGEGETETDSDLQSPMIHATEGEHPLVLSPTHLPLGELTPEDLTPVDGGSGAGGRLGEQNASKEERGASHQSHQSGGRTSPSLLDVPGAGPSPPPGLREESPTRGQNQNHNQDASPPSSSHSQNGLRKKRKHDERPPALPPIRISQFYVDSPTAARGGIEVTQVMDDSVSSSEGAKKDSVDILAEEGDDHYVLVSSLSAAVDDGKMSASTVGKSGKRESRGSPRASSGTPTVVIEEHQDSEYTPTTSEQSHDTSMSVTGTSQTSVSSAGTSASRTHSSGSVDTAATHTSQTIVDHNPQSGKSLTRSRSKSSKRSRSDQDHGRTESHSRASSSGNQEGDVYDVVLRSLTDLIENATKRDKSVVRLDLKFVEVIKKTIKSERAKYEELKGNLESMKRESQQFAAGLSASQQDYDREMSTRRDAQTEVRRLRVLVQEQAAKLSALTGEQRKRDMLEKNSKEMSCNLAGLEKEMSKLKVERDMTMAEMEELKSPTVTGLDTPSLETGSRLSKALSVRFDGIRSQYKRQLEPLTERRETLEREIQDLTESRKAILEETAALHARNEELMGLNTQIARNIENTLFQQAYEQQPSSPTPPPPPPSNTKQFSASTSSNVTYVEENSRTLKGRPLDSSDHNRGGLFKWSKNRDVSTPSRGDSANSSPLMNGFQKMAKHIPHAFQQMALLRVSRCDHCNDKMWGTQSRCQGCGISVHPRCATHLKASCSGSSRENGLGGTVFGRDLIDQVKLDARDSDRSIPVIVERCIQAIEVIAMDYEGLYRKSGGSGQVKIIEALFEKGNYEAIDLLDSSVTSDISSVTSVLKSYFRELPNPLMTTALHESFIDALTIKDTNNKIETVVSLLNQLPKEHYATLKILMLHLYQVQARKTENRMDSKNLGLIFGPTLMRSADVTREFGDMAGKTQTIELLVDHAPTIFRT